MRIRKWRNSLVIRLPKAVVDALDLKEGDEVEISGVRRVAAECPPESMWLERLRRYRGRMPSGFVFNRSEANER